MNYSIRSILKLTFPLILTALSANLMYASNKMILAYYSIDAMNAVGISSYMISLISFLFISIASTAEIFVGQYNGSKQTENLAIPVWQMIYLSLFANIFFIPLGYFAEYINMLPSYYKDYGVAYQSLLTYFCSLPCMIAAISAFFIGQGKAAIVTVVVILGNILNVILDIILIFGVKDIIPSFGARGAAIATATSEFVQLIILVALFVSKNNREKFKTWEYRKFNKKIFTGCFKIGFPISIGRFFEISAWYLIYVILGHVSKEMATIHGIAINVFVLFVFFEEGISKAVSTLSANLIGMRDLEGIKRLLRIFTTITFIVGAIVTIPLIIFPDFIFNFLDMTGSDISSIYPILRIILKIFVVNLVLETLVGVLSGILMSGGDTRYPVIVNLTSIWAIVVIPIIIMYYTNTLNSTILVWQLCTIWCLFNLFFLYRRYKTLKWYNKLV